MFYQSILETTTSFYKVLHLVLYVLISYSLYCIAKNHHLKNPWIAFLPLVQYTIIGILCEEYILLGVRLRPLWLVMIGLAFLQSLLTWFHFPFSFIFQVATNLLMALILHKFFYLFEPRKALLYAALSILGTIPFAIFLFLIRKRRICMSAGAFPYPFPNKR